MHNAAVVGDHESAGDLTQDGDGEVDGQRLREEAAQGHALGELHSDEQLTLMLPEVVDGGEVGVAELAGQPRLLGEPADELLLAAELGVQDLQGGDAVQASVSRLEDDAHAASTAHADYLIGPDPVTRAKLQVIAPPLSTAPGAYQRLRAPARLKRPRRRGPSRPSTGA